MRRTWGVAAASATLVLGGLAAVPASAGESGASGSGGEARALQCAPGDACFWVHNDYRGARGRVAGNNRDFRDFPQGQCPRGTWNDCISSYANRGRSCTVYFWTGFNYTGRWHSLGRNDEVPNFAAPPPVGYSDPAFNDTISSNHWCSPR
ncbi:peptidase inhibitor family I36 protein [Streptomyces flavofungini]|uniref:peptidase inhibitor family I36 protein n=1 Tax=Streptomyces flavofungini TaxID=68200 RepID=UPI0025B18C6F|nr:peptidase inhibitor family I36 protein [Streptomyces flavofungini]WJV50456.1 peptidase inhibitor family I36 protein [Streptomyces flavofungini]